MDGYFQIGGVKKKEARIGKVRKRSRKEEAWVRGKWMRQEETGKCENMGGWEQRKRNRGERKREERETVTSILFLTVEVLLSLLLLLLPRLLFTTNMSTGIGSAPITVFSPVPDSEQIPSDSICLTIF